jgi:hypothetical protein
MAATDQIEAKKWLLAGFFASVVLVINARTYRSAAMRSVKAITLGVVGGIVGTAFLLAFVVVYLSAPNAQATPAIGKGQPCKTCHTSSKPSKSDLKK